MQYFVTGATGFVGGEVVDQLVEAGHDVVALVRPTTEPTDLPAGVEIARGDITDKESMWEAMAGVDGVFHIAGWYRIGDDDVETAERVNVAGTRNVLELMAELEIPKGVYTSTLAVFSDTEGEVVDESYRYDGPHLSTYDRTKWNAHYQVAEPMMEEGLPLVIVLPGAVYGPGDRGPLWMLWEPYLRGQLRAIPSQAGYCWGHIVDTARAHVQAMEDGEPGCAYIIAGEPYTLEEATAIAEELTGIPAPWTVPPATFRVLSHLVKPIQRLVSLPPSYTSEALRLLDGVTYWGDNTRATRELGLEHRPFREGLRETLEHELTELEGNEDERAAT